MSDKISRLSPSMASPKKGMVLVKISRHFVGTNCRAASLRASSAFSTVCTFVQNDETRIGETIVVPIATEEGAIGGRRASVLRSHDFWLMRLECLWRRRELLMLHLLIPLAYSILLLAPNILALVHIDLLLSVPEAMIYDLDPEWESDLLVAACGRRLCAPGGRESPKLCLSTISKNAENK